MQIVLDYVTGKVSSDSFKQAWYEHPEIGEWLDQLIDLKSTPLPEWATAPYSYVRMSIHKHFDGSVLKFITASEETEQYGTPKWLDIGWHFTTIAAIIVIAFPDIRPTTYYDEERTFYMNAIGDYIGGPEVEDCIYAVMQSFPRSLGKTKRLKEAKAALKMLFHIEGTKFPRWVQEPEWPMGTKSPMLFISQKRKGECVQFFFRDIDTDETRIVEQYY